MRLLSSISLLIYFCFIAIDKSIAEGSGTPPPNQCLPFHEAPSMAEFTRVVRGSRIYYEIPRTRFYRDYPYKTGIRKELVMYFVSSSEDSSAVDVLDWYDWRAPGKTVMGMSEGQILRVVELRHDRWGYTIAPIRSGVVTNGSRYRKTLDSFHIYYQPVVSFRHSEQGLYEEWMWRNQNKGKFLRLAIECTVR